VPESTAHDAALDRIISLLKAWAERMQNGARIARNLAIRWLPKNPNTGLDPDVALLLPGPDDFDDLTSYRLWEPGRTPPPFAVEVVSAGHPYKDYGWVHEGYAEMGVAELLVFDPLLIGPKSLGGPVSLQLWQRDVTGAFERVHFGNEPVYSRVLDAWLSVSGRNLVIADDRAGTRCWPTLEQAAAERAASRAQAEVAQAKAEAERTKAEVERTKAEAERTKAEAERTKAEAEAERRAREALELRLRELEQKLVPRE
jgi:Uma2 family endonuclease